MSTLNALAQKHGITVPLRVSDCPKVLTIVKIDNQQVPDGQGGRVAADILTGKAENGTAYTVRLNQVTIGQLVRIFGPDAEIEGKRVLASTFEISAATATRSTSLSPLPRQSTRPRNPSFCRAQARARRR